MLHQLLRQASVLITPVPYREHPMEPSPRSLFSTADDLLQPGIFRRSAPKGRQADETPPEAPPRRKVGRPKGSETRPVAERTLRHRLPKPTDPATTQQEAVNNLEGMFMS
ncbi:hypothetical protein E4U61_007862 [Claviceps capensis]|nr:hypothetical protein E4U61_007862 [Claviceps capensis]